MAPKVIKLAHLRTCLQEHVVAVENELVVYFPRLAKDVVKYRVSLTVAISTELAHNFKDLTDRFLLSRE